jgi:hypothetical protein
LKMSTFRTVKIKMECIILIFLSKSSQDHPYEL